MNLEQQRVVAEAVTNHKWKWLGDFLVMEVLSAECWAPERYGEQWKELVRFIIKKVKDLLTYNYGTDEHKLAISLLPQINVAIAEDDTDTLMEIAYRIIEHE